MTCTTHHYACECREAQFAELAVENAQLKSENAQLKTRKWEEPLLRGNNEALHAENARLRQALISISEKVGCDCSSAWTAAKALGG